MRLRRLLALLAAGVLAIALTSAGALAQAPPEGKNPIVKPAPSGLKITLQMRVKFLKSMVTISRGLRRSIASPTRTPTSWSRCSRAVKP